MKTGLLLSGGMDSLALAWWKRPQWAITLDYGQMAAEAEIRASAMICQSLGIDHEIVKIDCGTLGSGDLTCSAPDSLAKESDWWPYRNQLLITLASMRAITRGVSVLHIGTVSSDRLSHLDGEPEFVKLIGRLLAYQEGGLQIEAPAIEYSTADLVRVSGVPPGLLAWAHSCHKSNVPCGNCRGCNKYDAISRELGEGYWNELGA